MDYNFNEIYHEIDEIYRFNAESESNWDALKLVAPGSDKNKHFLVLDTEDGDRLVDKDEAVKWINEEKISQEEKDRLIEIIESTD